MESVSFEDAIEQEQERLYGETDRMLEDEGYYSFNHQHFSYLSRGVYVDQLQVWMSLFLQQRILILKSEDFYEDPSTIFGQVLQFLGLPSWEPRAYEKYNFSRYPEMNAATRRCLADHFAPHNERLYDLLGVRFGWN
jgi:hypothetical protein